MLPPVHFPSPLILWKTFRYVPGTVLILPAVIATRVAVLEVVKEHVYTAGLGLLYIRVSQMKTPKKRRCKIDTPLCAAGGTASHQHMYCVTVRQIWQHAAKCQSSAEHFCTTLDAKEFFRFPLDTLAPGPASSPLTFSATL
jgi:hypothetical protein